MERVRLDSLIPPYQSKVWWLSPMTWWVSLDCFHDRSGCCSDHGGGGEGSSGPGDRSQVWQYIQFLYLLVLFMIFFRKIKICSHFCFIAKQLDSQQFLFFHSLRAMIFLCLLAWNFSTVSKYFFGSLAISNLCTISINIAAEKFVF